MADLTSISKRAARDRLSIMGAFHPDPQDMAPGTGTLVLLGPGEPGFWEFVSHSPEFVDGKPDPMDRWSARVIDTIAKDLGGMALYPFGRPPRPFISWALKSGRAWASPVGLLVHDAAGLLVSYRGAVLVPERLELDTAGSSPCDTCTEKPCLSACPAGALDTEGYRLRDCHAFLDTDAGQSCMEAGCSVRLACPISRRYQRDPAQSAYHMRQFH